jgi:hypothetical protein
MLPSITDLQASYDAAAAVLADLRASAAAQKAADEAAAAAEQQQADTMFQQQHADLSKQVSHMHRQLPHGCCCVTASKVHCGTCIMAYCLQTHYLHCHH